MKFHYLGQQLLDSNCLLLVMKMFGMQDMSMVVVSKVDIPELEYVISSSPRSLTVDRQCLFQKFLPILPCQFLQESSSCSRGGEYDSTTTNHHPVKDSTERYEDRRGNRYVDGLLMAQFLLIHQFRENIAEALQASGT